jgi:thiol:disulfide interchange protein DsbC
MKDLPLENAIKTVRGNGKNTLVVFADANCGFCKKYEAELKTLDNVTIYTVMYPVLSPDSKIKARAALCAKNPEKVWNDWMAQGKAMPKPADSCQPPLDQILAFGRKHDIGVTPTTFLENGKRFPGFLPLATLKAELAAVQR